MRNHYANSKRGSMSSNKSFAETNRSNHLKTKRKSDASSIPGVRKGSSSIPGRDSNAGKLATKKILDKIKPLATE